MILYILRNKENQKVYVGQTNHFKKRMNGHMSTAFNPNSSSYNTPIARAIRKYGWKNFDKIIIHEDDEQEDRTFINTLERFYIQYFGSLNRDLGYNIDLGGQVNSKPKLSLEEKIDLSNLFTLEDIKKIQSMMVEGRLVKEIREKFPLLSLSMAHNINAGLNFKDPNLTYPLFSYKESGLSRNRTQEEMELIRQDLIQGMAYKDIGLKWDISQGMVSLINSGKQCPSENHTYPLSIRGTSRSQNAATWVPLVQKDLLETDLPMTEIAKKYNKAYSTIKKINSGSSHRKGEYEYPLR